MVDNLLYFPYINLPQNDWCTRALLYWDNIGIVAPQSLRHDPSLLRRDMRDLTDAGLVSPLHLDFEREELKRFAGSFFDALKKGETHQRLQAHPKRTISIHFEKFQYDLVEELCRAGIATRSGLTVQLEEITGLRYLAGLAAVLSNSSFTDFIPATDDHRYVSALTEGETSVGGNQLSFTMETESLRTAILERVLPAPANGLSALEISDFKEQHGEALGRFRRKIERIVLDLASSGGRYIPQRLGIIGEEIQDGVDQIRSLMQSAGWTRIGLGSFWSFFVPVGSTIGTAVTGGTVAATIAAASIIPPVLSAFRERHDIQRKIAASPFAYAAFADSLR